MSEESKLPELESQAKELEAKLGGIKGFVSDNPAYAGKVYVKINFPAGIVNKNSYVVVSISEIAEPIRGYYPIWGGVLMSVYNVIPRDDNVVVVLVKIEGNNPVPFRITLHVL